MASTAARDALLRRRAGAGLGQRRPALNPIGSTLIRHLLRAGRPDAALAVFEILRAALARTSRWIPRDDLRTLAEYAESAGRDELAASMRLETPVYQPDR